MDNRELSLLKFYASLEKKMGLMNQVSALIEKDKEFHNGNPYFIDSNIFKKSQNQTDNALEWLFKVLKGEDAGDEIYNQYREFFDAHLDGARKDIISNDFLIKERQYWQPVFNQIQTIKSFAMGHGLKPQYVEAHLERYIKSKTEELLCEIPKWDGVDRIKLLSEFIKFKDMDYSTFEEAFKEWGATIFRRLYEPNAQNRCIILKGIQGIGKDRLIQSLLSSFWPYYSKFSNNRDERSIWDQITSNLVLHIEEFDQTGNLGVAFLKDLITRDFVTYRSPYARASVTRKCHSSFISTVNIDAILRDETGNRRFAVFEIESIDWNYPKDMGPQIMSQFFDLYQKGYKATQETWEIVKSKNAQFEQVDMVPELLELWESRTRKLMFDEKKGMPYSTIEGILSDVAKSGGWKHKSVLNMLKTNGRSKHTKAGTRYWPGDQRVTGLYVVTGVNTASQRVIVNHAPGVDTSPALPVTQPVTT